MYRSYFEVIRPGINTTFQDLGRKNLYHIGIPFSGAMDNRNFILANAIAGNKENTPIIEFAYQGPLLKFKGEKVNFNITGNVSFKLIKKEEQIEGNCYQNYTLEEGDQLDILSTDKSVYGYLAISGNFDVKFQWGSCSTNTKANVGANDGKKTFFEKEFEVTKLTDRMGMRLEGPNIENIIDTNIKSEGIIKGVIQVPADGNPIIMLSDHGTIGGYPKIGVVISSDYDKLVQLAPGSKIKFQEIELSDAEILFKLYEMETQNILNQIR